MAARKGAKSPEFNQYLKWGDTMGNAYHGSKTKAAKANQSKAEVPSRYWPRVICHTPEHVGMTLTAAAGLGLPVTIVSPSADTLYQGPHSYLQMVLDESESHPDAPFRVVLDCGEGVGYAIAVIRRAHHGGIGVDGRMDWSLQLEAKPNVLVKVRDLANLQGLSVDAAVQQAVDIERLQEPEPVLDSWLKQCWSAGVKAVANEANALIAKSA